MSDTIQASAARRQEAAHIAAAHFRDQLSAARLKLVEVSIGSVERRRLRERIAQLEADIADAEGEAKRLGPAVEAERAEAAYQRARDVYEAALSDGEAIAAQAQRIAEVSQWLAGAIATTTANIKRVAHVANLPHEMILPGVQRFAEHVVGRLVHAGVLEAEMPFHLQAQGGYYIEGIGRTATRSTEQLLATDMQDAAQALLLALKAHAPRSPAQHASATAEREAQRQREADELRTPLPKLPAPPPVEFRSAR